MEITLYNKHGHAAAYIGEDGKTIFTWDGRAVAYLNEDKIFGWNGRHLGWLVDGTVFDIYGMRAGFIRTKSPVVTHLEPMKPEKRLKTVKNPPQVPVARPVLCYGYSQKTLEEMLAEGSVP
jgi:hypothetical protein